MIVYFFFFSSRRRHTRCALVTGVQTCALPICSVSSGLLAARWPLKPCSQAWAGVGCFLPAVQKYDGSDKIRVGTEREYARRLAGSGSNKGPPEHAESNMIRTQYAHMDRGVTEVRIRTIGIRDLQLALCQGWEYFWAGRGDLVIVGCIY